MQDSIEDYLKLLGKTKQDNHNRSSNDVEQNIEHKKKCEKYAFEIVQILIEGSVHPSVFLRSLSFINQEHYQDIVEERAISHLCGYALCKNKLPRMPKKQFHISEKLNKIFDISERKNFCSNLCYTASSHIKKQVDTSQVWLRSPENSVDIKLYNTTEPTYPGIEIPLNSRRKAENVEKNFTSVASFTEVCLDEVEGSELFANNNEGVDNENLKPVLKKTSLPTLDEESSDDETKIKKTVHFAPNLKNTPTSIKLKSNKRKMEDIEEGEIHIDEEKMKAAISKVNKNQPKQKKPIMVEIETNPEKHYTNYNKKIKEEINPPHKDENLDKVIKKVKKLSIKNDRMKEVLARINSKPVKTVILIETKENPEILVTKRTNLPIVKSQKVEKTVLENLKTTFFNWFTLNTYIFIHGEEEVKKALDETTLSEYFDKLQVSHLETSQQIKYMKICKKMQLRELAEDKFHSSISGQELKLPPDYHQLKEDASSLKLKVRSFYSGELHETENTNFPQDKMKIDEEYEKEGTPAVLPLADASSLYATRKRIFISSVSKYVQNHTEELKLDETVLPDVLKIAKTFKLEANNMVFKPLVWKIIAIVLLFILSKKDENLKRELESKEACLYIQSIFNGYEGVFLEEILEMVSNVNEFVERHITN